MENLKHISLTILYIVGAIYFAVATIGKAKIDTEQREEIRLNIEVLKLKILQFENH
jgi:hypothetical protein|tara:strand:+ start:45 stop:212 length:168 start_codon:yes stop_codon:yes gene_type:complete